MAGTRLEKCGTVFTRVRDLLRAGVMKESEKPCWKFYEVYGNGPRPFDFTRSNFVSTCQRFVEKYQELEARGEVDEEKLFEATSRALLLDGVVLRRRGRAGISGLMSDNPQDSKARNPVLDMKLQDLLKGMQEEQQGLAQEERQLQAQQETQSH
ncbi:28S ribosomal protein S23, mitochondrial isoform X2 [Hemiscyllium ocellatum]|uniref:28S ribosomal protein S23, mitochondrial isoform X2 n=1 Tax=Hemiscyllium ocellatum TaxID=170820 RepID=UPI002965F014|nr:28S ribosomal protein S23, mitochondrial isoform X2 [Hemiscyllium ocellatum]